MKGIWMESPKANRPKTENGTKRAKLETSSIYSQPAIIAPDPENGIRTIPTGGNFSRIGQIITDNSIFSAVNSQNGT